MASDAYLYKVVDKDLIEKINKRDVSVNVDTLSLNLMHTTYGISTKDSELSHLSFGKDITMISGTQELDLEKDKIVTFDYLIALIVDSTKIHDKDFRKKIEEEMLKTLGLDNSTIHFAGIYSEDRRKLLTDV